MDKRTRTAMLLDLYGALLTKRAQTLMRAYYDQDLSLSEIAENEGVSRQGIHDALRRAADRLEGMEARLGFLAGRLSQDVFMERLYALRRGVKEAVGAPTIALIEHIDRYFEENPPDDSPL